MLREVLFTHAKIRLAVFEANRHKEKDFLSKWETGERGSVENALKAFDKLISAYKTDD